DRRAVEAGRWQSRRGAFTRISGAGTSEGGDTRTGLDNRLGSYATFDTRQDRVVEMRIGVSFISVEQAQRNLGPTTFDQARSQAQKLWADALATIQVEGGTDDQRRVFESALYRT